MYKIDNNMLRQVDVLKPSHYYEQFINICIAWRA